MILRSATLLFLLLLILGGSCKTNFLESTGQGNPEIVMTKGMRLEAFGSAGNIEIEAGEGYERIFRWGNGCERSVEVWPRQERWYGSLGLYYPGPAGHWKKCDGVSCVVFEEGQMHFASEAESEKWIDERYQGMQDYVHRNGGMKVECVFTNSGIVVLWGIIPRSKMLQVEIWQIMIEGKPPTHLTGARDDKIILK